MFTNAETMILKADTPSDLFAVTFFPQHSYPCLL